MELLVTYQLDIMLFMSGVCAVLTLTSLFTRSLTPYRRSILTLLEAACSILLLSDRLAYLYRGDPSRAGFWMVRITNFLVFFLILYLTHCITLYLGDVLTHEGGLERMPRRLIACKALFVAGITLLVVSQFTGLYYTFDESNTYVRSPGYIICFAMPLLMGLMQMSAEWQYRHRLGRMHVTSLLLNSVLPMVASLIQAFHYGISLTNMTVVGMAIMLYLVALADLNRQLDRSRAELERITVTDDLTQLPNIRKFEHDARSLARREVEEGGRPSYLIFDLVHFQTFNDRFGYDAGDALLCELAAIVCEEFSGEPVAREAEDNFVALSCATDIEQRASRIRTRLRETHPTQTYLDVKVGAYPVEDATTEPRHALDRARLALRSIKRDEGALVATYDEHMESQYRLKQYVLNNVERAVREGYVQVYYQPVVWSRDGRLSGLEALVRWIDPDEGFLSPAAFIPTLEEGRQIHKLDLCVYEAVCKNMRECLDKGLPVLPCSLNFSRLDFELMDAVGELEALVERYRIPRRMLHVEVTESALTRDVEGLRQAMGRLHELGYSIWLDDFGAGYSSMNVLKDFEFDLLKIDMEFLRNFHGNTRSRTIISHVIRLAEDIGMRTLCEGVETEEAVEFLQDAGCERLQGYFFGKPMPYADLLDAIGRGELRLGRLD